MGTWSASDAMLPVERSVRQPLTSDQGDFRSPLIVARGLKGDRGRSIIDVAGGTPYDAISGLLGLEVCWF